ncbi:MAG: hypothetical protein ACI9XO_004683 [Paraglaciecola sp.]
MLFQLDKTRIDCLKDGAFSLGRAANADFVQDDLQNLAEADAVENISGVLLRSELVAGWPALVIEGFNQVLGIPTDSDSDGEIDADPEPMPILRMTRSSGVHIFFNTLNPHQFFGISIRY